MSIKYEYNYDDKGNQAEEISSKADGSSGTKYSYKFDNFDKNNNWVKKITAENDKPSAITYREIDYF